MSNASTGVVAGTAFDRIASTYDLVFTDSLIGRAQRNVVWKILLQTFHHHDNLLELNCGTGEDALFLGANQISVFACDASQQMIARADQRLAQENPTLPVVFCHLPIEHLDSLQPDRRFDGVFSNFSGLNCVQDLASVAVSLSVLVKPGDRLLLCFSTRVCLIEILYYFYKGSPGKALRRCKGSSDATIEDTRLTVYYPTLRQIRRAFKPHFKLRFFKGVGVAIPPSYLELWAHRNPAALRFLCKLERLLSGVPILRATGDHVLLCFEKVTP